MTGKKIEVGRPRLSVDFAIVLRMRDMDNLGWSRMAEVYRELIGEYVSRDTMKRRYLEAKATEAAPLINSHRCGNYGGCFQQHCLNFSGPVTTLRLNELCSWFAIIIVKKFPFLR